MFKFLHKFDPHCGCFGTGDFMPTREATYSCPEHDPEMYRAMIEENGGQWTGVDHPQGLMLNKWWECAWVDVLMVPVIEAFQNEGHTTYFSCQGDDDYHAGYLFGLDKPFFLELADELIANQFTSVELKPTIWGTDGITVRWDGEVRLK